MDRRTKAAKSNGKKPATEAREEQMPLFKPHDCIEVGRGRLVRISSDTEALKAAYLAGRDCGLKNIERCSPRWNAAKAAHNGDHGDHYRYDDTEHLTAEFDRGYYVGCVERMQSEPPKATPSRRAAIPVRYRNPETGETWSGRGLQPRWFREAIGNGATPDQFEITPGATHGTPR